MSSPKSWPALPPFSFLWSCLMSFACGPTLTFDTILIILANLSLNQIKVLPSNSLSGSLLAWQPEPKSMRARLPVFKLTKMFSSFMSLYTKVSTKVNKKYVERSKMTQNENNGKVDKIKFKDFFMEIRGIFFLCTTFLSRRHVTACSTWNHWALTAGTMRKALFLPEWRIYVK